MLSISQTWGNLQLLCRKGTINIIFVAFIQGIYFYSFATMTDKRNISINGTLIMSTFSVLLCWMYGITGLVFGIIALVNIIRFRKARTAKGMGAKKIQWALLLCISGLLLSSITLVYYIMAFSHGTFIRFF